MPRKCFWVLFWASRWGCHALQIIRTTPRLHHPSQPTSDTRRTVLLEGFASCMLMVLGSNTQPAYADNLQFTTSVSGIQWADAKVGTGSPKQVGEATAVDYVLSTTGARYGSKIYSTQGDTSSVVATSAGSSSGGLASRGPYRWTLGDGSTIKGLEIAITGESGMPAMLPGGVRRVILPSTVAYASLAAPQANCQAGIGPVPPPLTAFEEFQRFKNIYCNPNRVYQPDVVMDIKLYGRRAGSQ